MLGLGQVKLKQNRPNGNDWGDNEKILIDINEIWVTDIKTTHQNITMTHQNKLFNISVSAWSTRTLI